MAEMTPRERVLTSLRHEEPDRVPMDLSQGPATGIHYAAYERLIRHLGSDDSAYVLDQRGLVAEPTEAVLQRLGVDFRKLRLGKPEINPEVTLSEHSFRDEWGVVWVRPEDGHYINGKGPFQDTEPELADLESYRWPDPRDPGRTKGLRDRARQLREETDYAVVLNLPYSVVRECQRVRGFREWMEDLVLNPKLAEVMMERCLNVSAGIAEFVLDEVGDYVDVVSFPDDMGFQDRPYVRPELYRSAIKPYHRKLVEAIKRKTEAKVVMHSDGSVYPIIADLIDVGIDALNPVQVSAKDMDSVRLKREFGADLSFWGGIDTHRVLPSGTPEDVRTEVESRVRDLGTNGGYVLASVHNIQAEVPAENIVAMFDTARKLSGTS